MAWGSQAKAHQKSKWGSRLRSGAFILIAVAIAPFAYINRHDALIYLNPLAASPDDSALALPVFLLILGSFLAGIAIGFSFGRWRAWRRGNRTVSSD